MAHRFIGVFFIYSCSIIAMESKQRSVPTLRELAFRAAKPELNQQIEAVLKGSGSCRGRWFNEYELLCC